MTGQEMITHMRESMLDDAVPPYLWSDTELLRFLNYAEVQACRRAHLIIDASTTNDNGTAGTAGTLGQQPLCTVSILANTPTYTLSAKILQIRRCQLHSMTQPLIGPVMYPEMEDYSPGWMGTAGSIGTAGSGGYPSYYLNEPGNTLTLVPAPSANDTAKLVVSRLPLTPFTLRTSPEIAEKYHEGMMNWGSHLAFMKPDSETFNDKLAKSYEERFTEQFGPLFDAYTERMLKVISQSQRMRARPFGS